MPGLKRSSLSLEDDEDDDMLNSSVRSKRLRLSSDDTNVDEDDLEDDGISSDEDGPIDSEERAAYVERRKDQPITANAGIVESVTCTNFMCHSHFTVELGPLINFITGHNGSGKSAVLTALQICMGGKASSTNRGNSLKSFIKEGEESCTLQVVIKNKDGYQHETYGDSITVERTFNRSGSSGFKIKSAEGRTITTTKGALDDMLDYHGLIFDNPICVLTQDMARQFLVQSTSFEKYKFFIKGVQLEQLNHDYELLEESIDHIRSVHDTRKNGLEPLKKAARDAKRRLDILNRTNTIHDRINLLGHQYGWAQVEQEEHVLEQLSQKVRDADDKRQDIQAKIDRVSAEFRQAEEALAAAQAAEREASESIDPLQSELDEAKKAAGLAQDEVNDAQSEQRKNRSNQTEAKQQIKKTEGEIADERRRLEEETGGTAAARIERMENARRTVAELEQENRAHAGLWAGLESKRSEAEQRLKAFADGERRDKERDLNAAESRLKALRNTSNQARDGFPPKTPELINAINNARNFDQKPIGPIGKHIRLTDAKWSSVLEKTFGGMLNGFIVTSRQDRDRLSTLMRNVGCSMTINIMSARERLNVSANAPDPEHATIARMLNIDNDLVFNQMVIAQKIEQVLLIENESEAMEFMAKGRIKNVRHCLTLDQSTPGIGHAINWNSQGSGVSSTFVDKWGGQPRMQTDKEDQIRQQQVEVNHLRNAKHTVDQKYQQLQRAVEDVRKEQGQHNKQKTTLRNRLEQAREDVDAIQTEIDGSSVQEGRLQLLLAALEKAKETLTEEEDAFDTIVENKDKQMADLRDKKAAMEEVESRFDAARRTLNNADAETRRLDGERQESLRNKNKAFEAKEVAQTRRSALAADRDDQDKKVQAYIEEASKLSHRIPVPGDETVASLKSKLDKLIEEVEKSEREAGGSREELAEEVRKTMKNYRTFEKALQSEEDLLSLMTNTLANRRDRWERFRKYIAARARNRFTQLLSHRGYKGGLLIDHTEKKLAIQIQPNHTESKKKARSAETLSGGERSFSNICLVLSLWEAINAPVRCLDEYDVFMDSANRAISTGLLVDAAREATERQFIFITPQSMNNLEQGTSLKIHKMSDPRERGQQQLNFGN